MAPVLRREHRRVDRERGADVPLGVLEPAGTAVRARQIRVRFGDVDVHRPEAALAQREQFFPGLRRGGDIADAQLHVAVLGECLGERIRVLQRARQAQALVDVGERALALVHLAREQRRIQVQRRIELRIARRMRERAVDQRARPGVVAAEDQRVRPAHARRRASRARRRQSP